MLGQKGFSAVHVENKLALRNVLFPAVKDDPVASGVAAGQHADRGWNGAGRRAVGALEKRSAFGQEVDIGGQGRSAVAAENIGSKGIGDEEKDVRLQPVPVFDEQDPHQSGDAQQAEGRQECPDGFSFIHHFPLTLASNSRKRK